jgi:hypothetical protein
MNTLLTLIALLATRPGAEAAAKDLARLNHLYGQVAASYDSARGGFVTRDQAPDESEIELAFAVARELGDPLWAARARRTVSWMTALYDSTGGGFFQTLKDADRMHPGFEKTTWTNARRLENLIDAQRGTDDQGHIPAAKAADYIDRVLTDGRGGFVPGQVGGRALVPEVNGEAIRAWLRWAAATADPRTRDFALKSLDRVWETCWVDDRGLMRPDEFGDASPAPRLTDQAEMGRAFVLGAHLAGRQADLDRARTLGDLLLDHFEDTEKGGFCEVATPAGSGGKVKRGGRKYDQNASAVRFLAELASITGQNQYRDAARRAVQAFDRDLGHKREDAAEWALALRALKVPDLPQRPDWKEPPKPKSEQPRVFRPTAGK